MLASYPKATHSGPVLKYKKKIWKSCQGNKMLVSNGEGKVDKGTRPSISILDNARGKGGVGVGSALFISTAKGRRKGRKKTCISSIAPLIIQCKPLTYSERFHWWRVEQLAHSVPLCLGPSRCPQQAAFPTHDLHAPQ